MLVADPRVQAALFQLKNNCTSPINMGRLAAMLNLSPSRLRHLIKAQTGSSPCSYVRSQRIQLSAQLLETTWLSVKQITERVGYRDSSHFVRDFKTEYGVSPRQYRSHRLGPQGEGPAPAKWCTTSVSK